MNKKTAIAPNRRAFLTGAGAVLASPAVLTATRAYAATPTLRVGHVSPRTGPLAGFAEADDFVLAGIEKAFAGGIETTAKAGTSRSSRRTVSPTRTAPPKLLPI